MPNLKNEDDLFDSEFHKEAGIFCILPVIDA